VPKRKRQPKLPQPKQPDGLQEMSDSEMLDYIYGCNCKVKPDDTRWKLDGRVEWQYMWVCSDGKLRTRGETPREAVIRHASCMYRLYVSSFVSGGVLVPTFHKWLSAYALPETKTKGEVKE